MSEITTMQGLTLPAGTDGNNVVTNFAAYNAGAEPRLVQRYVSAADRTARNPFPDEGELSYLRDLNRFDYHDGVNWVGLLANNDPHTVLYGESGEVSVSFATQSSYTQAIAFMTPFINTPRVFASISTSGSAANGWIARTHSVTTTGFTLFLHHAAGTAATWTNVPVHWTAIAQ